MPIADPEARRQYAREWVARRRDEFFANGTRARYQAGCRCDSCCEAKRVENAAYRRRKLARVAEIALAGVAVRGW